MNPKLPALFLALFSAMSLLLTGCGGGGTKMETKDLQAAFESADPALKGPVNDAIKALNSGKLFEGSTALANVAKSADKLSEAQKAAMLNVGANIQLIMANEGDRADLKVYQAVEDMISSLDGRDPVRVGTTPDRVAPPKASE